MAIFTDVIKPQQMRCFTEELEGNRPASQVYRRRHQSLSSRASERSRFFAHSIATVAANTSIPHARHNNSRKRLRPNFRLRPRPALRIQREGFTQFEHLLANLSQHRRVGALQ